jgi:hydroxymethylbilane synthase
MSDLRQIRIGARSSRLSLAQTSIVSDLLRKNFGDIVIEVVPVRTLGDKIPPHPLPPSSSSSSPSSRSPAAGWRTTGRGGAFASSSSSATTTAAAPAGAKGAFTGEIEAMLLQDEIDIAVHSMKDMTSIWTSGLTVGATPPRADPRDTLILRDGADSNNSRSGLGSLPRGARVGTSSLRRKAQLLRLRPDVDVVDLHGNVDTRLRRLFNDKKSGSSTGLDAIVLAMAGLERLGEWGRVAHAFSIEEMVPAVGQGVIAVQMREGDADVASVLSRIDDETTRLESTCERAFARRLGADCNVPVGGCARLSQGSLTLVGMLANNDCSRVATKNMTGPPQDAVALGTRLAEELLEEEEEAAAS